MAGAPPVTREEDGEESEEYPLDPPLPAHGSPATSDAVEDRPDNDYEIPRHGWEIDEEKGSRMNSYSPARIPLSRHTSAITTTLSIIRSRPTATREPFRHSLSEQKTGSDVIVEFDGPDDPYRPLNWPFRKKVITTVCFQQLFTQL